MRPFLTFFDARLEAAQARDKQRAAAAARTSAGGCNLNEIGEAAIALTTAGIDATRIGNCIPHQNVKFCLKATTMALKGDRK